MRKVYAINCGYSNHGSETIVEIFKLFNDLNHSRTVLMLLSPHTLDEVDNFWVPLFS